MVGLGAEAPPRQFNIHMLNLHPNIQSVMIKFFLLFSVRSIANKAHSAFSWMDGCLPELLKLLKVQPDDNVQSLVV